MDKNINWLKKNKRYLSIKAIAEDSGISVRVLHGTINGEEDGHGTPFKVPEKHTKALEAIIKQITTLPKQTKRK